MEESEQKISAHLTILLAIIGIILVIYNFSFVSRRKRKRKKPRIFISHSWKYRRDYDKLIGILEYGSFMFYNHSISERKADKSLNSNQIEQRIWRHLIFSRCLLVFAGKDTLRMWVKKEVFFANKLRKKIIVVKGNNMDLIPNYLEIRAAEVVPFKKKEIINSILEN